MGCTASHVWPLYAHGKEAYDSSGGRVNAGRADGEAAARSLGDRVEETDWPWSLAARGPSIKVPSCWYKLAAWCSGWRLSQGECYWRLSQGECYWRLWLQRQILS